MTDNPRILAARDREAYGWKLDKLTGSQHAEIAARRAAWAEFCKAKRDESLKGKG